MRPQLNTNNRHLCSPSNPVTAELFGDDLPKAVKDITDTNRLEWSGFDPWPGSLCCILRQDTLLSVLFFTQVYKWVPANMLGVTLRWTSTPSGGGVAILLGASC